MKLKNSNDDLLIAPINREHSSNAKKDSARRAYFEIFKQFTAYLLIVLFVIQSNLTIAAAASIEANANRKIAVSQQENSDSSITGTIGGYFESAFSWFAGENSASENNAASLPPPPSTITSAAVSRHHPSLNGGKIDGSLRVLSGESYTFNSTFQLTGDLYTVGTPNVTVNSGASHGGILSDGGSVQPNNYGITLNSGAILPGKIHQRADAIALPSDIPSSVPNPAGTRYVNINSPADLNSIGSWATVRSLTVSASNLTINVPPGNYDTFSMNGGNIKLVFSAGTYNFSGTISLNNASRVESNGAVTINVGQGLNINNGSYLLGANTSSSDVKLNVVGSSLTVDNGSQINALVRAVNANVNFNNGILRGQIIANYLNINNGQIIASTAPADTTPPTLNITAPANNSTTQSAAVNVSGTASDASGITSVTVNNSAAAYNASTGAWNFANLNLNLGSNTITVKATDGAGNVTTQIVTVTRQLPPDTTPPTLAITAPANNATVPGATITVSGTAADTGTGATGINRVVVNGQNASYNSTTGQWTISGVQLNEGANTIQAVAYDNATPQNSSAASIVVNRQTPDTNAPTLAVTSPANNSETFESGATITGTAIDEGLNASGVSRITVNGTDAVYNASTHQWSFPNAPLAAGDNNFTIIAYDSATPQNQSSATLHIKRNENPPPALTISSPADNFETTNETVAVAGTATANGAAANQVASVTVNNQAAGYDAASGVWTFSSLALSLGSNVIVVKATDTSGKQTTKQVTITRNPINQAPTVGAGADRTIALPNTAQLNGTATDDNLPQGSSLTFNWSKTSGGGEVVFSNPDSLSTTASFSQAGVYVLRLTASDGALSSTDDVTITVIAENHAPQVSAGDDRTISLPAPANLNGAATDDGLPAGSSLSVSWEKVSGAGNVTFANPNSASTSASFSAAGTYVLRLSATDGDLSASDELTVTVNPANQPPAVEAGDNQTITLPGAATLGGIVNDDNLPDNALTVSWSKSSGPGEVVFSSPNSVNTTAAFSVEGTYELKLEATDSELSASDTVTIQVQPAQNANAPMADFTVPTLGGPVGLTVVSASSSSSSASTPNALLDEDRTTSWNTEYGQGGNQYAKFEIIGGEHLIERFKLQQTFYGVPLSVKDFVVQVSTTTADDSAFSTVFSGAMQTGDQLQEFVIPGGAVYAKYVKLIAVNTYNPEYGYMALGTFQVIGAGTADNIISLPGRVNVARMGSPSFLLNGAAITRYSSFESFFGGNLPLPPVGVINGYGWTTKTRDNEFVVIKFGGDKSYMLSGIRIAGSNPTALDTWVRNFEVWVSNTIDEDAAFTKVLDTTKTKFEAEDFIFPGGAVYAKYVKFVPKSSGHPNNISTGLIEVLGDDIAGIEGYSSIYGTSNPSNLVDNNPNTYFYFTPGQTTNQWVKLKVGGTPTQKIYGVRVGGEYSIYYGNFAPRDYQIRVSTTTADDSAFTVVKSGTFAPTGALQEVRFDQPVDAKYVQFYFVNGYSADSWLSIYQLEVLAIPTDGAQLTSVTSQAPNYPPVQALDLDQSQPAWITAEGQNTNQNMTLRLHNGELWKFNHVSLRPGWIYWGGYALWDMSPKDFDIQVSTTDDADSSFTTVFSGTTLPADRLQHFYFPTVSARFVRLVLKNNYGNSQIALKAFYVYSENTIGNDARFFDHSTDADGDIVSYQWNFGDGTTGTERNPSHVYAQEGVYDVALTVTDSHGASNTTQKTYRALPTLKADFSYTPAFPIESDWYPNSVYFADASSTRLRIAAGNYAFITDGTDWGNIQTGTFSWIYRDNGTYPTTIKFGSDYVLNYATTKNIIVQNVAPGVDAQDGKTVVWGEQWTNVPSFYDLGPADRSTLSGVWNFGDGQTASCANCTAATATANHAYDLPGTYTATLSITDKDGGTGTDTATYVVNRRPTRITYQNRNPQAGDENFILRAKLSDAFGNQVLGGRALAFTLNGASFTGITGADGVAQVSIPLPVGTRVNLGTANFAGDALYAPVDSAFSATPDDTPDGNEANSNQGTDFWITFTSNYDTAAAQRLFVNSAVDTNVLVSGCGWTNQPFAVAANTIQQINLPGNCTLFTYLTDLLNPLKGVHLVSENPVTVYGLNQRVYTSDAFLAIPTPSLGKEYYILSWGNLGGEQGESSLNGTELAVIASENNTTVTIIPKVSTFENRSQGRLERPAGIPYTITLNKGVPYEVVNQYNGETVDLSGSYISADKPIGVYGGSITATIPQSSICCADHLVEQLPPVSAWGKRFVTMPLANKTKGDYFRYLAAEDDTEIFVNGTKTTTINRGEFYEKLVNEPNEIIATKPIMVAQYATSSFFDPAFPGDPFMMIISPYSQWLGDYTISTPGSGFTTNFINITAPTNAVGNITLDGSPIPASSFQIIGNGDFSGARIPIPVGTHRLNGTSLFGVFVYGFSTDEGYGYPGGMNFKPSAGSATLALNPETAAFGINSEACVTTSLKDRDANPLGGKTIDFSVGGAHQTSGASTTDAAGQAAFCYTGTNTGSDTITANFENLNATATFIWTPPNTPPTANAGDDRTITLPGAANISGASSDDGYPAGNLTFTWSKLSGSGNVAFADSHSANTTASFDSAGSYVLRFSVSDGQFTTSDDVQITVNAAPPNQPPTANAGDDRTVTVTANLLKNPGAESDLINGELPGWTEVSGENWTRLEGENGNVPAARFGAYVFSPNDAAQAELRQDIDVRAFAEGINDGTQQFEWKAYVRSLAETNADSGKIVFEYRDATNQNTIATLDSGEITTTDAWHLTEDTRVPPAGTGFIRIRLTATRNTGETNDVFFDGMSLRAVGGIAAVKLSGAANDDGLPSGSSLTSVWTKVSGDGNVVFGNSNALDSSAKFDAAGSYVLRLTTSDGQFSASDETTVTVNAANQTPQVFAGADRTIILPATATLSANASDDGGNLRYRWTRVSGTGTVSFSDARSLNATATFSLAGIYVLRVTAEDGELEASDDVTITVNPSPLNQPPTVEAGNNQTIVLPVNSVTLSGTATDDGLPANNLTITWTKTSGNGNVSFANASSAAATATFDAAGSYVLRLTASDGQYTVWDELAIVVNPQGAQNQPPTVNAGADQTITQAQAAILEAEVSDDGLPAGGSFSASWTKVSGAGDVTFSNPNQTATYANFSQTGTYVLRLAVSDSELSATDDVTVTVAENQPAPAVEILTPDDGISITEPTQVSGNISSGNWKLEYSLTDTDDLNNRVWTTAASGSGAASGNLGSLDTTLMLNGLYDVRLISADQYGQTASDIISVSVENNLKVGHFTISFEDMNVPVAGIPIQITRTYDSRDKRKGDFGIGWTLGVKNVRVEKNNVLGLKWYQTRSNTFIPNYCVEATRPHIVTVTMPDGKLEKFEATLDRQCQQAAPITEAHLSFAPQAGTRGTLSVSGDNTVLVAGSVPGPVELVGYDTNGIFDRTQFKYTSKDGTEFVINQGGGLESVKDTNGNTLTISASGIVHSSGKSIGFTRDAQGRITHVTDPEGVSNVYTYDANGDLISYKDRENNTTSFTYEPTIPHHLKSIVDPLNRTPIRNDYDASGRLLKHTDANGEEIVYTHDLAARVEIVRDRLNNETRIEYDARGNVLKKRDALGGETTFSYDANDNVLTETNALGKTTAYTYDAQDNRTSITDALNDRTEMTYNTKGQVLTVKDALNNTTTITYDTAGNLLTTTDAMNNVTTNTYSIQNGQLISTKDAQNNLTRFEHYNGYLIKQTDAQNNETTFGYDANGNRNSQTVKRTNANGQIETITTVFEYDNLNRSVKATLTDGSFTRTEYNTLGQQSATIDQAGNRTEFEYDTLGRLIKTIYADGKFEESTFDAEGRRLTSKDRAGKVTAYEYDALGRLKKATYADGSFTQTNYNAAGQVLSSTGARGNSTYFTYDDAGRRLTVKNALNQITSFAYDANGNQLSTTDALNHTTAFVYDTLNRRTRTNFADGSFVETTFDTLGRRTAEKDQAGKITQFFYDSLGRLTKVKDALNQETVYDYNELGQQTLQKDALGRETKYEYDKLGRRTKRILPLGQTETYSYDTGGNLQSRTDFNGKTTTLAYDNMRRLISKTPDASLNQPTVSFTYNNLGQRATMTDASGTTNYNYDNRNRLSSKQTPFGALSYTYNETGNIETLRSSNSNGVSVDYAYDELNRLSSVKDNRLSGNQTTGYIYDAVGNLQSYTYPNEVTTSYAFNNLNRLTTMSVSNTANNLASYQYTLGAAGNRTQVVENTGRTVNYVYDDLYRLTSETIANSANNGQINYQYDAVGNRLQRGSSVNQVANQTSTFDADDRMNSDTYDANGNTKASNGKTYNYDFENKLISTSSGITIVYDGDGNRVSKTINGVTTNYLVDTNNLTGYAQVVEEIQNSQVGKTYTYGLDLISQRQGATVNFYQYDGHGSVRNLTDNLGSVTDSYAYDAFGNLIERTGATDNNYLYAGEQFDADLGFYYNRARYLNVETGRFISQDSYEGNSSEPKSLHKYTYTSGNPVTNTDPSGNMELGVGGTAVVVAIVGILAALALPPILTSLFRNVFGGAAGNAPAINIDTQPVIVEGGGWDEGFADNAMNEAADFWSRWANIKINRLPTIRLNGLPTDIHDTVNSQGIDENLFRAKLAETGLSPKHTSIFVNSITAPEGSGAHGESVPGGQIPQQTLFAQSAIGVRTFSRYFLRFPASQTIAHEWGHSFGLEHTFFPVSGLMTSTFVPVPESGNGFYQNTLSGDEITTARNGAERYR
ncbi:MAG: PKD domain-containing protein [Pyrinomonadaceae bacterium]